jgi:serine/threonine protein kinase/WD40 repeat protein
LTIAPRLELSCLTFRLHSLLVLNDLLDRPNVVGPLLAKSLDINLFDEVACFLYDNVLRNSLKAGSNKNELDQLMPERPSKAESIFFAAREIPIDERESYLKKACGDDARLRKRVEQLLVAEINVGDFLQEPLAHSIVDKRSANAGEGPGSIIGPYKLLQEIGEGGFGVVYMAEQSEPIRRTVALKIVKPGMDTREVIARFEAERQALAMMDHTNIARVFDAGTTESGRPYFVMELVKGVPITEFCDKNNLSTDKRLELFVKVCDAVQHAHQKGVIHRDLKPANVMITAHERDPVPKVIDFGVSKALSQRLTEKTLFTRHGQMIGTPQYMSPEQAEMTGLDVDTRSDIYSLGVLLYELLTGTTPLEADRLRTAGYSELLRMIQHEEPSKPSTRLSSLGDSLTIVCEHRKTDPTRLRQLIRGELDWIVMKALEKHRDRRYETANGMARDIQRHLRQEPVHAGPPSATYRLSKMIRRNRLAFIAGTAILASLVIALIAVTWGFTHANYLRGLAEDGFNLAKKAEETAIKDRNDAVHERNRAEVALQQEARQVYLMHLANADKALLEKNFQRARVELYECKPALRKWEWRFLESRYRATIPVELPSFHNGSFTRDGTRFIARGMPGSPDKHKMFIWDVSSGAKLVAELPHKSQLTGFTMSPDDKWLITRDEDGNFVRWNLDSQKQHEWIAKEATDKFGPMAFSKDGLIATENGDTLTVFNATDGSIKFSLELGRSFGNAKFSPNGRWLVASSNPSVLIEVSTGTIVRQFSDGAIIPTFSPNGRLIATGNIADQSISLWDWDGAKKALTYQRSWKAANSSRFTDLRFHADGKQLVSVQGAHVIVWDVTTTEIVNSIHTGGLTASTDVNSQQNLIAFSAGNGVRFWSYKGRDNMLAVRPHESANWLVEFSPDGQYIALGSHRGQHRLSTEYDTTGVEAEKAGPIIILDSSGQYVRTIPGRIHGFSWIPDGGHIVIASNVHDPYEMYDAKTGQLVHKFTGPSGAARPFVSVTGQVLTSVGKDLMVRQWDIATRQLINEFPFHSEFPEAGQLQDTSDARVQFLQNKLRIASVGPDGHRLAMFRNARNQNIALWDVAAGEATQPLQTQRRNVNTLVFSEEGNHLYVGSNRAELTLFDLQSNQEIKRFNGHFGPITGIAVRRDQQHIVSSDFAGGVIVWDVASARPLFTLSEAPKNVDDRRHPKIKAGSVAWSPDSTRIAVGRLDGTLEIWNVPTNP